ncbi:Transducin/WD40 repeat-like superfamily protein [Zea mays]|uniref:Transducin/WD40 repeat-like superfamily protein n=1 Tax=Zea mays TaxID=4577 RepID=A0A1D6MYU9_MAIZE|nr:Transducin/WD40 repeat-like superfamily protein [Zea mays]
MAGAPGVGPGAGGGGGAAAGLKTYFKTPEGRYKLQYEKAHSAVLHYSHGGKTVSQLTVAYLKEKPASQGSQPSTPSASSGMRSAAARLLGTGNGSKALSFGGGNGASRAVAGSSRVGGGLGTPTGLGGSQGGTNYDGKGTYIVFNAADTLFISDLNSQEKDPLKSIHFSNSNPLCHAFDPEAKEGHDLIIGMGSGDELQNTDMRQSLVAREVICIHHDSKPFLAFYSRVLTRCTSVAWVPEREGIFVVSHSDGNLYVYDKNKDGNTDCTFPAVKDQSQFMVAHAKSSKSNPVARWHICQGSINAISFSPDGAYLATVGRDGYLRVFDFSKEQLIFGGRSYYGALLCCTWRSVELLLIHIGPHQVLMEMEKMYIALVLLGRTPNYFCGTWHWMRLLSHYGILQVPHLRLAAGALPHTGTMHALQQVFFNLLLECEMSQNYRP